jgi:chromosomal replication initiation ATPase DnaA
MRQQLLELTLPERYSYGDWVQHAGAEAAHNRLALWLVHGGRLWLRSESPAGKTHLLHALADEHPHIGLISPGRESADHGWALVNGWLADLGEKAFWMVDVEAGPPLYATGIALFHLIERAREMHRPLLIAWRCPDAELAPPELASRIKGMEQVEIAPPRSDDALRAVLMSVAASRQWQVDGAVLNLLLSRLPRDLSGLIDVLDAMERSALQSHRRLTSAWVRKYLNELESPR